MLIYDPNVSGVGPQTKTVWNMLWAPNRTPNKYGFESWWRRLRVWNVEHGVWKGKQAWGLSRQSSHFGDIRKISHPPAVKPKILFLELSRGGARLTWPLWKFEVASGIPSETNMNSGFWQDFDIYLKEETIRENNSMLRYRCSYATKMCPLLAHRPNFCAV